jgi:hypothetical protein
MQIVHTATDRFEIDGLKFRFSAEPGITTKDEIFLFKDANFVNCYLRDIAKLNPRRVFEFGIFQGGSALFLAGAFDLERYSCLDICDQLPEFEAVVKSHRIGAVVRTHYNVGQDDADAVRAIFAVDFYDAPPDFIIDDCSHEYELTKRSFEITWPMLKSGGHYLIEDWAWAHWDVTQDPASGWSSRLAPTNLVFDLVMALGSTNLIESIEVKPPYVVLTKSSQPTNWQDHWLDGVIKMRGKTLNKI